MQGSVVACNKVDDSLFGLSGLVFTKLRKHSFPFEDIVYITVQYNDFTTFVTIKTFSVIHLYREKIDCP